MKSKEQNVFSQALVETKNYLGKNKELIDSCKEKIKELKFSVVRGMFDEDEIVKMLNSITQRRDDFPIIQKIRTQADLLLLSRKLAVGGNTFSKNYTPRAMEIIYLPLVQANPYCKILSKLIQFRNKLYGINLEIGSQSTGDWFTVPRLHHYPKGGGFLAPHVDKVAPLASFEIAGSQYFQVSICMSKKGEHFNEGGGYVTLNSEMINFDKFTIPGDVVIYDETTTHGVLEVDPLDIFEFGSSGGRTALFATLYKKGLS